MLGAGVTAYAADRAGAADPCQRHRDDAGARARIVTGTGPDVVVIGDSWSVGLGQRDLGDSWPSRLPGRVRVAGFSGSGFSAGASPCARASFAARAAEAVDPGVDVVVVAGGLNDFDQPAEAVDRGFGRLMDVLAGRPVVVVGPARAPARSAAVPKVEALLARLSAEHGVPFVSTSDLSPAYLRDRLHLTRAGHRAYGDEVAARLAEVSPQPPRGLPR